MERHAPGEGRGEREDGRENGPLHGDNLRTSEVEVNSVPSSLVVDTTVATGPKHSATKEAQVFKPFLEFGQ